MKPGLYPKMPMAEYIALQAFSSGLAQTILAQSPLHAWTASPWNPKREREDNGTADIGTFAHASLLEGGTSALVVVEAADWRTSAAKQARDEARAAGRLPILAHKVPEVAAMVKAAQAFIASSEVAGIFDTGAAEQTIIGEVDGVLAKCRPDWLAGNHKISLSYKTTGGSAHPDAWIRTQLPGYDIGIKLYEHLISDVLGVEGGCRVVTLVQEQQAPHSCAIVALSPSWEALADARLSRALAIWRACMKEGKFPAYPSRICYAEPKPWMVAENTEQEITGSFADPAILWEKP